MSDEDPDKVAPATAEPTPDPLIGGAPLSTRVEAKRAEQINPIAVRSVFVVSALVLSGAFVFAFVLSPNMRAHARAKALAENQRTPPGSVKPSDVLGGGPRDYAELTRPPPADPAPEAVEETKPAEVASAGPAHQSRVVVQRAPRAPRPAPAPRPHYDRLRHQRLHPKRRVAPANWNGRASLGYSLVVMQALHPSPCAKSLTLLAQPQQLPAVLTMPMFMATALS